MKELNQLTIKQLLASNTIGINNSIINANFAQLQEIILLINKTFGVSIGNKSLNFPDGQINTGNVNANLIKLPIQGDSSIQLRGSNGEILSSGINVANNIFIGKHAIVGNSNTGGRLRLILDRSYVDESIQPGIPGQIRFIGRDYEVFINHGEVQASFSFDIESNGQDGQYITVLYNGITAGTAQWNTNNVLTAQSLVNSIYENGYNLCLAEYNLNRVTIKALPGLGASGNFDSVSILGTIPVSSYGGNLSGGVDGIGKWVSILGSVGPTGPTGPGGGPTGPTGPMGPTGPTGYGVTGPTGPTGSTPFYFQNFPPTGSTAGTIPVGSFWYHSDTGVLYIYVYDNNSYQWVTPTYLSGSTGSTGSSGSGSYWNVVTVEDETYDASNGEFVLINANPHILTLPPASLNARVGCKLIYPAVKGWYTTGLFIKTQDGSSSKIDGVVRDSIENALIIKRQWGGFIFISDGVDWFIEY